MVFEADVFAYCWVLADVIAMWQMEWPLGWIYFNLSSEMFNRTSSHMWGRWYLPMFLLRDGLFTLMYIASLIALMRFLILPPHNTEIFNGGTMTCDVVMVIYWGGGLQVFPEPLSKCSWWLPYIFIITVHPVAFKSLDYATLLCDRVFVFGSHQDAFDGVSSFMMYLYPMFSANIFQAFT